MKFDPRKPVQTRDGRKARIICTDLKFSDLPIVAAIDDGEGVEEAMQYRADGIFQVNGNHGREDLINIPAEFEFERWVNVYPSHVGSRMHQSAEGANRDAGPTRIACVRVVIKGKEGDGL